MSVKQISYKKRNKFTVENLGYFVDYAHAVRQIPWRHLKFLDEARFESRDLMPAHGRSVRNVPLVLTDAAAAINASYTVTMAVSAVGQCVRIPSFHSGINDADNFLSVIMELIDTGFIGRGDVLVLDNAPIHTSREIRAPLVLMLEAVGARRCSCQSTVPN